MKKLLVASMVLAIAGAASANLLTNGDFDASFTDGYGASFNATTDGSWAYMAQTTLEVPNWQADNWGYVKNWANSNSDPWGHDFGVTVSPQAGGAAGSWGAAGHMLNMWQNTGAIGAEGDTATLTFWVNSLAADYGANAWMNVSLQFIGDNPATWNYNATATPLGLVQDTWTEVTLEVPALSAGQAGKQIQVHVQAAGVWIDDMDLTVIPEPATLGLVAAFGGAIFMIRKKLAI